MIPRRLADLDDALANCMKCGFCKAACPVFLGEETTSPRAKIRLARAVASGAMEMTPRVKEQMERCLNCRACADECPSGVEPNKIALAARCGIIECDGLPLSKRVVFSTVLKKPKLMAMGARMAGVGQIVTRREMGLPLLGSRNLLSMLPEELDPLIEQKTTVVYFPGCAATVLYPEIGLATVSVLRKLGAKVILPHDLVCCSTPAFNSGDVDDARDLASRNIETLKSIEADHIVTSCGSCGLTISQEWTELLGLKEAEPLARKVIDISEFVVRIVPDGALAKMETDRGSVEGKFTYHDSCHLRRGMRVYEAPRRLLKAILGDQFIEMELADRCCGGGGTFSIYHPKLSQIVAETKMECIARSGADVVVTGCPACIMQLRDSLARRKMTQKVMHTVQIIDLALPSDE